MGLTWPDIEESIRLDEVLDDLGVRVNEITRSEHWASCPLPTHPGADSSPSFSVNEESLLWNCFTCNDGGPLPLLVVRLHEFEDDPGSRDDPPVGYTSWQKALEYLLPFSDGDVESDQGFMEQLERYLERADERPKRTRRNTLPFYSPRVFEALEPAPIDLFEKWGIKSQETIDLFGIRYDPERRRFKNGKEFVGPAIIIPHWFRGELVGYQERWPDERPKWLPKYTNSDDFPKRETLFNWDRAVEAARRGTPVGVIESVMTNVRLEELGYPAVATFGAGVRPEQLRLLASLPHLILSFDNDPDYVNAKGETVTGAGVVALREVADALSDSTYVEIVPPIDKEKGDLADLVDDEVHDLWERRKPVFDLLRATKRRR